MGKGATSRCPPSFGNLIMNGGQASTFSTAHAFAHPNFLRLQMKATRTLLRSRRRLWRWASTEAIRLCLPLMDCLSECLLLRLDEFGNFNGCRVFWLRAAAVVRNDTDTGVY